MEMNRPAIKQEARNLMGSASPNPILVGLVFVLIIYVLNTLCVKLTGVQVSVSDYSNALISGDYGYFEDIVRDYHPGAFAVILDIALRLTTVVVSAGFVIFCMNTARHMSCGYGNLLDGFGIFFRIIWLDILISIFIALWSLLLVVPGIIAAYRYRMALFLLLDNPEKSALACISESKRMMTGHKAELFVMDLSFIGWYILEIIPFVSIWVTPYTQLSYVLYYEALRNSAGYAPGNNY